jgi:quinol monooxygenase YgiN
MTSEVHLNGKLICADQDESARVHAALPAHIDLTRAEHSCLSFDVTQSADPLVWDVCERFVDAAAFTAHQTRTAASEWAEVTAGIKRDYKVTGST